MTQLIPLDIFRKFTQLELEFAQLWEDRHSDIDLIFQYPIEQHKIDFCHPQTKVAIECQGGTWVAGMGHSSGKGIQRDCKKFCTLATLEYLVFPLTCDMITPRWIDAIAQTIRQRL